jgi:hypothetical protein
MLNELNLPTLQSRRHKQGLIFFYKVVEGQVPAMLPDRADMRLSSFACGYSVFVQVIPINSCLYEE